MKSQSNIIPFDFVLKIKLDRDFILKNDAKKKSEHLRGKYFLTLAIILVSDAFPPLMSVTISRSPPINKAGWI